MRFIVSLILVAMTVAWALSRQPVVEAGEQPLTIVSGPPGGQWQALGDAMVALLKAEGIAAQNLPGGGLENLRYLAEGKADIGFTLYSFLGAAEAGEADIPGELGEKALLLANLYPQVLYIIVRKEVAERHHLRKLQDLLEVREKLRFSTLPKDTGSEFIFNVLLKNAYRTNYDRLREQGWTIEFQSYAAISEQFLAGELDVCVYTAGPGTYLIPALEEKKLDAVLLAIDEEKLNLMTYQFMTIDYIIHKGDYASVQEDISTLGDYSCLVVREGLPEELVYRINTISWVFT